MLSIPCPRVAREGDGGLALLHKQHFLLFYSLEEGSSKPAQTIPVASLKSVEKDYCRSLVRAGQFDGAREQAPGETPDPRLSGHGGVAGWPQYAGSGLGSIVRVTRYSACVVKDENGILRKGTSRHTRYAIAGVHAKSCGSN